MTRRFVEWQQIDLRLDGEHLSAEVARQSRAAGAPVSELRVDCLPGEILVHGKVHKFIAVPFQISVRLIEPLPGQRVRIHLDRATAFGIPLPTLLIGLVEAKMPDLLRWHPESNSLIAHLDQILPSFLDVEIASVSLVAGAILITLGPGGADPPPRFREAPHGEQHRV